MCLHIENRHLLTCRWSCLALESSGVSVHGPAMVFGLNITDSSFLSEPKPLGPFGSLITAAYPFVRRWMLGKSYFPHTLTRICSSGTILSLEPL